MNIVLALIDKPALAIAVLCLITVYAAIHKLLAKADRDDRDTLDTLVEDVCALQNNTVDKALGEKILGQQDVLMSTIAALNKDIVELKNKLTNEALRKGFGK